MNCEYHNNYSLKKVINNKIKCFGHLLPLYFVVLIDSGRYGTLIVLYYSMPTFSLRIFHLHVCFRV